METQANSVKKNEIIVATWQYLMEKGLGKASVGDLCRETNLAQSSLYYWFENKEDIWISAGKYGLSKVVGALLGYTLEHITDVKTYFETLLDEVEKYKYELRLAVQITTSPVFGDYMRSKSNEFKPWYEKYAESLIEIFGCTTEQVEVFIYTIISLVVDYAIWDDREKTQMLLDNLYARVVVALEAINEQKV